jgi:hypothetical protein
VDGTLRVHGPAGRDQRLAGDLPAEHTLRADLRALAAERGGVELLEVQHLEQLVDRGLSAQRHGHPAARTSVSDPSW